MVTWIFAFRLEKKKKNKILKFKFLMFKPFQKKKMAIFRKIDKSLLRSKTLDSMLLSKYLLHFMRYEFIFQTVKCKISDDS